VTVLPHRCRACGKVGWSMKISLAYSSNRTQDKSLKWICRNRKACIARQRAHVA
jgi:hypothetical protein